MELWIAPEGEEPAGLAKNEDGELIICDDCPCGCGGLASSYLFTHSGGTPPPSGPLDSIADYPCPDSVNIEDVDKCIFSGNIDFSFFGEGIKLIVLWKSISLLNWRLSYFSEGGGCLLENTRTKNGADQTTPVGTYSNGATVS